MNGQEAVTGGILVNKVHYRLVNLPLKQHSRMRFRRSNLPLKHFSSLSFKPALKQYSQGVKFQSVVCLTCLKAVWSWVIVRVRSQSVVCLTRLEAV